MSNKVQSKNERKEKYEAFIQEQLTHRNKIDEEIIFVQQTLMNSVSVKLLELSIPFLNPQTLREVAEERSIKLLCGNCVCKNKKEKRETSIFSKSPKFYLSSKEKKVFDYEEVSLFCSDDCFVKFKRVQSILSTESLYTRSYPTSFREVYQTYKQTRKVKDNKLSSQISDNDQHQKYDSSIIQIRNSDNLKREIEMLGRDLTKIKDDVPINDVIENEDDKMEVEAISEFEKWLSMNVQNDNFFETKRSYDSFMYEISSEEESGDEDYSNSDGDGDGNEELDNKRKKNYKTSSSNKKPTIELPTYAALWELLHGWCTKETIRYLQTNDQKKEVQGFIVDPKSDAGSSFTLPLLESTSFKKDSLISQIAKEINLLSVKLSISKDYIFQIIDNILSTFNYENKAIQLLPIHYIQSISLILIHLTANKNQKVKTAIDNNQPFLVGYMRSSKLSTTELQYLLSIFS